MPGWKEWASVLALGVLGTGIGYLLYYGLIAGAGASRAILVTYLVPPMALVYGALILDEPVTADLSRRARADPRRRRARHRRRRRGAAPARG